MQEYTVPVPAEATAGVDTRPAEEGQEHGGSLRVNTLSFLGNLVISLASVAPTASIALTLAAIVATTGYASPIAILICAVPMLGIAVAYRRLNMWHVNCGSTYIWGGRAISPYFGWMVGWVIILAYFLGATSIAYPIGPYALSIVSNRWENSAVAAALIGALAIVAVTAIAYVGIRATSRFQTLLLVIEYTAITIVGVLGLMGIFGGGEHSVPFAWDWFSWHTMGGITGFVNASLIAVYMYSGWDTAIVLNEETRDARRNPGRAVIMSVLVVAFLFAFFTFALQGAVKPGALQAHGDNALTYIAEVLGNTALAKLMILTVVLSAIGSTLACIVAGGRVGFAMGYDRVLPPIFGRTHPRYKTPVVAMIAGALIAFVFTWLYAIGSSTQSVFESVVSTVGLLFALFYTATGLAVAVYYRRLAVRGVRPFLELALLPLGSAAFLGYIIWRSIPELGGWTGRNMEYLYVLLGIGVALMLYARWRKESDYFQRPLEAYDPASADLAMSPEGGRAGLPNA
jgi:amino acid transporter